MPANMEYVVYLRKCFTQVFTMKFYDCIGSYSHYTVQGYSESRYCRLLVKPLFDILVRVNP